MRILFARLPIVGAFALALAGCATGGTSLPYAGPPNNAGGSTGTNVPGGTGQALIRFVQGSPALGTGASGTVDVCIDNLAFGVTKPAVAYGQATGLYAVSAGSGVAHTISVYPGGAQGQPAGSECPTAPGPYFGESAIAVVVVAPPASATGSRLAVVLGGTTAANEGLYVFAEPNFAIAPGSPEAVVQNAAPTFSATAGTVGFGFTPTGGAPTNIPGANAVAPGKKSGTTASVNASTGPELLPAIPASFYDGAGAPPPATVVPIATATPEQAAGQPYVVELYAIDAAGGTLNLVAVQETTTGYGF